MDEAGGRRLFNAALESGAHRLKGHEDRSGFHAHILVGAQLGEEFVQARLYPDTEPEPVDENRRRFVAVKKVFHTLASRTFDPTQPLPPVRPQSSPHLLLSVDWAATMENQRGPLLTFKNVSDRALLILPQLVAIQFIGEGVSFRPYPGPPISPFLGAFTLTPNASKTVPWRTDGVFVLCPGLYRGRARIRATRAHYTSSHGAGTLPPGEPWVGEIVLPEASFQIP